MKLIVGERETESGKQRHTETDSGRLEGHRYFAAAILTFIFSLIMLCHSHSVL